MFERFTDRARRVVVLAQEEARMLNHNYIGTEHILLGSAGAAPFGAVVAGGAPDLRRAPAVAAPPLRPGRPEHPRRARLNQQGTTADCE